MQQHLVSVPQLASTVRLILALMFVSPNVATAASVDELDDAAARLQYAFYSADLRGLQDVLALIQGLEIATPPGAKDYQLAYGHWKLAQLYADPSSQNSPVPHANSLAGKAADRCVKHARIAMEQDARMAEAYALEAVCSGMPQGFLRLPGLSGGNCEKSKSLRTARELAPTDPRVQLVDALCSSNKLDKSSNTVPKWLALVASFEAAPPSGPGKPDWGHVEALTLLGESYLQRGETVPARDALERALVLAPDYRQAQRLLEVAAARPR
jgi:tetratricopeptide (TPR) repeat protein